MLSAESILKIENERLKELDAKYPNEKPEGYTSSWETISDIVKHITIEITQSLVGIRSWSGVDRLKLREHMDAYEKGKSSSVPFEEIWNAVSCYGSSFLAGVLEGIVLGDFHYFTMITWWALREYCDFRDSVLTAVAATDYLKTSLEEYNKDWADAYNNNPIKFRFLHYYVFDAHLEDTLNLYHIVESFAKTNDNSGDEVLSCIADGIL